MENESVPPTAKQRKYNGNFCQVPGCSNQSGRDKLLGLQRKYHRFPGKEKSNFARRRAWLKAIPRDSWSPKKNHRICSDHFAAGKISYIPGTAGYIPTVFTGADKARGKRSPKKRLSRTSSKTAGTSPLKASRTRRKHHPIKSPTILTEDPEPLSAGRPCTSKRFYATSSLDFSSTPADHDYVKTTNLDYVQTEVESLATQLNQERELFQLKLGEIKKKTVSLDTVKNFRLWTNFPNRAVFDSVAKYLKSRGGEQLKYWRGGATSLHNHFTDGGYVKKPGPDRSMTFEEELFMVIVKLKSGLNNTELAQLFGISDTQVGHIFTTLINFLHVELKLLFELPPLDEEGIAHCFKKWDDLMIVLDCTELPVEKSSSLTARKQMYSNYKGRDTVKFSVSLGRNLCVNYVSKAYGGRASDKFITLDSHNMLDALPVGSKVMTDRGFNVGEELREKGVQLIIPTFKGRGRTQMTKEELGSSENIAMARIHVERIIQRIRTYQILEKTVKLSNKDIIEQIFTCCAYLSNFQLPIIQS